MTIDVEAESQELKQRSLGLIELLDAGHPTVVQPRSVLTESKRLARETLEARRKAAVKVALGEDPGCVVSPQPPLRRVDLDWRGRDTDPFHGASVVTGDLIQYWTHRRDVVFPAVEGAYRQAMVDRPYSEPLVAAARGHLAVLRGRQTMLSEGGADLEASLARYEQGYLNLRQLVVDSAEIAGQAETRLASLRRIVVEAELGDGPDERGFLAAAVSATTEAPINAETLSPLLSAEPGQ